MRRRLELVPAGVTRTTLRLPGGERAALVSAPHHGELRGTVVCVHGFTGSKEDWAPLLPALALHGWRAVAFDSRGHHESPPADDYSLAAFAADTLDVARAHGEAPAHLVGHSFGSLVVRTAALAAPDRVASVTLVAGGPGAIPPPRSDDLRRQLAESALTPDLLWRAKQAAADGREPDVEVAFRHRRALATDLAATRAVAELLLTAPDETDALRALDLPVLVVTGERDDAWPVDVQAEMARRLGTEQVLAADAEHSPAYEQPDTTVAALAEFLDGA